MKGPNAHERFACTRSAVSPALSLRGDLVALLLLLVQNLVSHGEHCCQRLVARGLDLRGRQQEAERARVAKLHAERVLHVGGVVLGKRADARRAVTRK